MSSTTKITSDKAPVELGNVLTPSEQELASTINRNNNFLIMKLGLKF